MIEWLQTQAAIIVNIALGLALLGSSIWLTGACLQRLRLDPDRRLTWAIAFPLMAAIFVGLAVLFAPVIKSIDRIACREAIDYEYCLNG